MVPIHTHPPSKEYDEGWDRIFGKNKGLKELTELTEEFGGYLPEQNPSDAGPEDAPADPESKRRAPDTD